MHKVTATVGAAALLAAPLSVVVASPATAADREFRCAGADVDFDVEKDDSRFEVDIDKNRPDTGKDVFKVKVKKIGGAKACTRTITRR